MEAVTLAHVEGVMRQESVSSNLHTSITDHPSVSCLLTEVLQHIFILIARECYYTQWWCPRNVVPSWVSVSYVCCHWRNVALECPSLWAYLFISSRRWTEELLARSKQASLKMHVNFCSARESTWSCVVLVMDHIERIQELGLRLPATYTHQVLSKLSSHAPRLQNLEIHIEDSSVEWPSLFLGGISPALRTLELSHCPVVLNSFGLSNLTILHLVEVPDRFRQNMEEFLAVLSCMQDLKHLYLLNALPDATGFLSGVVFRAFEKIALTRLCRLWIRAPLPPIIVLLSCLDIPLNAEVRLECNPELQSSLDYYAMLRSLLPQRYTLADGQTLSTIRTVLMRYTEGRAKITFSPFESDFTELAFKMWDRDIALHIELYYDRTTDALPIINGICSSMPLSNVGYLSVNRPPFPLAFWRSLLEQLPGVQYIALENGNVPDLSVLSYTGVTIRETGKTPNRPNTIDEDQSHLLAPRLEELVLKWMSFLSEGDSGRSKPAITRRCLFDILSTRQGFPGRLTLIQCDVPGCSESNMVAGWGDGGVQVLVSEEEEEEEMVGASN